MKEQTEIDHWQRFLEGDEAAYTALYRAHVQAIGAEFGFRAVEKLRE